MTRVRLIFLFSLFLCNLHAQPKTDAELLNILRSSNDSLLLAVLNQPDSFLYRVIYTRIDRDKKNRPSFHHYYLNVDPAVYFNPASTVKLPLAVLSLEKMNTLKAHGVDMYTLMQFDSSRTWHKSLFTDSTSETGKPTIAHFIKKALLVSDNDAYNRMYQFLGQQTINRRLREMGLEDVRICRQFMGLTPDQNRYTNPVRFISPDGSLIYRQPEAYNTDSIDFSRVIRMGRAHLNAKDSLVNAPIDFTYANNLTVEHLQKILQWVMFPSTAPKKGFRLTKGNLDFLYRYLSQYPSETEYPKYDTSVFYDSFVKFYFRNETHRMPPQVRVFNKVGWAYGCLTDVSYVVDFEHKVEFMLTATIYVNSDGILNDGKYEYESIGWPFMHKLGQTIYHYELKRERTYKPNLSRFQLEYRKRKEDDRPLIKEVDN